MQRAAVLDPSLPSISDRIRNALAATILIFAKAKVQCNFIGFCNKLFPYPIGLGFKDSLATFWMAFVSWKKLKNREWE